MKKMVILLTALAMIAGFSTASFAVISGSAHDLSGATGSTGELCNFCHTPHNADVTNGALWSHAITGETFTMYTVGGGTTTGLASGKSALCLSCHDGVTNVDAFGGDPGSAPMGATTANVGTNLLNDHPVMIAYSGTGDFNATPTLADVTDGVQCSSCHDPHLTTNGNFLRANNGGSALCLDCHNK